MRNAPKPPPQLQGRPFVVFADEPGKVSVGDPETRKVYDWAADCDPPFWTEVETRQEAAS